jgi:dipeptidyl aminopeptidase/acylaminoacyl peptidase
MARTTPKENIGIRHTKYACWTDPDVALERMSGPIWTRALKEEAAAVNTFITTHPDVAHKAKSYSASYRKCADEEEPTIYNVDNIIDVEHHGHHLVYWRWKGSSTKIYADDIWVSHGYVISTEDIGHGDHTYILKVYNALTRKLLWSTTGIGEGVGVYGNKLYVPIIKNRLWAHAVIELNLADGKDRRVVMRAQNERENCYVYRRPEVYIAVEDSQEWRWYAVPSFKKVESPDRIPAGIQAPRGTAYGVEWAAPALGLYITKKHGSRTLWYLSKEEPKELLHIPAGSIIPDPYVELKAESKTLPIVVLRPDSRRLHYRVYFNATGSTISRVSPAAAVAGNGLVVERQRAVSADGTIVHYLLVRSRRVAKPKRLLAIGYGAYALSTYTGMLKRRWGPWLEAGWGLAVGFIRGGGDHDEAWAQAGRRWGRKKTHEDMEAVIRSAQKECGLGPQQSCIYGRSAGGYLVGALLARNPGGELFRGIYTEVPYVDVLQTTTNPSLPLTRIEYGEFGNPAESLADFIYVGLTSPATAAAAQSCPGVFVLARTAAHDSQVYTYEAVKWVRRLRANAPYGEAKLCIVEEDQGHFTPPDSEAEQYGLDLALVETAFQKS